MQDKGRDGWRLAWATISGDARRRPTSLVKVLVLLKRVLDPYVKISLDAGGKVQSNGVKTVLNPFCANALEQAVQWREGGVAARVDVLSIGPAQSVEILRFALAIGADAATLLKHPDELEPLLVAKLIAAHVAAHSYDVLLFGKQAIDDDSNQTAQMVAARLGWPQALFLSSVELRDGKALCRCEVDAGIETIEVTLPCVLSADLRLNEPRIASLPNIMKAKRKPLTEIDATSLGVDLSPQVVVERLEEPAARQAQARRVTCAELVTILREKEVV